VCEDDVLEYRAVVCGLFRNATVNAIFSEIAGEERDWALVICTLEGNNFRESFSKPSWASSLISHSRTLHTGFHTTLYYYACTTIPYHGMVPYHTIPYEYILQFRFDSTKAQTLLGAMSGGTTYVPRRFFVANIPEKRNMKNVNNDQARMHREG
jgi:hypothetical protein